MLQLLRRAHGDLLLGITQAFPHAYPGFSQARFGQGAAQIRHAVLSPHQGEDPGMVPEGGGQVPLPAMEAQGNDVLIIRAQPGTEGH